MKNIKCGGVTYAVRETMGTLVRFKRATGVEVHEMNGTEHTMRYLYESMEEKERAIISFDAFCEAMTFDEYAEATGLMQQAAAKKK